MQPNEVYVRYSNGREFDLRHVRDEMVHGHGSIQMVAEFTRAQERDGNHTRAYARVDYDSRLAETALGQSLLRRWLLMLEAVEGGLS